MENAELVNHCLLLHKSGFPRWRHRLSYSFSVPNQIMLVLIRNVALSHFWTIINKRKESMQKLGSKNKCTTEKHETKIYGYITRRARFAASGCPAVHRNNLWIPHNNLSGSFGISRLEHQTVLPLDWVPEAPSDVRCTAGYPGLRIERAYCQNTATLCKNHTIEPMQTNQQAKKRAIRMIYCRQLYRYINFSTSCWARLTDWLKLGFKSL